MTVTKPSSQNLASPSPEQSERSAIDWQRFGELIHAGKRFVLTSHVRPDADALGSELGMAGVLAGLGKHVRIVNDHATPPNLQFLDPDKKILSLGRDIKPEQISDADVLMVLDTSAWNQLGRMADVLRGSQAVKVVLDHHKSSDDLGAETFKDVKAEATGRLVVEAAHHLGVELTQEMALPLMAALTTDTGWFRFSSTNSGTLRCAAELVAAGAVPAALYQQLYERNSLARLHLMGLVLSRVKAEADGRLVHTYMRASDLLETGALVTDSEDIINVTLTVAGSQVALFCVEQPDGQVKVSFRSRSQIDVSKIAEEFAGGGHHAASGAMLAGPLEEAQRRVLDAVRAKLR